MKRYMVLILVMCSMLWSVGAWAYDLGGVNIHGFISQGYMQSDRHDYLARSSEGTFEFNEMGLNFTSQLTDELRVGAQLFAQDLGDIGNDEITLDWAYGDYRLHNMLGIRAGKIKIAHGLYNETRDIDTVRTFVFLPRAIYDPETRDTFAGMKGANLYGELPAGFSYHASVGVIPTTNQVSAISQQIASLAGNSFQSVYEATVGPQLVAALVAQGAPQPVAEAQAAAILAAHTYSSSITDRRSKNARNFALRWSPTFIDGLRLSTTYTGTEFEIDLALTATPPAGVGLTEQSSSTTLEIDEVSAFVFSMEYMWENLMVSGEYEIAKVDIHNSDTTDLYGYAISGSYRFSDLFELGTYYSEYVSQKDQRLNPAEYLRDACLSGRFDLNEYWTLKLEGHLMRGLDQVTIDSDYIDMDGDGDVDVNDLPRLHWMMYAAKITYMF